MVLIGGLALGACGDRAAYHDPVLLDVTRAGPRVDDDTSLDAQFARGLDIADDAVWVAACHATLGVEVGQSLNSSVVVLADPAYMRVGEMLTDGEASREEATAIEAVLFADPDLLDDPTPIPGRTQIERSRVDEYLALRSLPPRPSDRYLAYVHSLTTRTQQLLIVDTAAFLARYDDPGTLYPDETMRVAGDLPVAVEGDACKAFTDEP